MPLLEILCLGYVDMNSRKKGILGIGNILLKDEGFGVHVVRYLEENFKIPDEVEVLDGGTSGMALSDFIKGLNHLLIIDVVRLEDSPGTLKEFSLKELMLLSDSFRMSPHQVGILDVLSLLNIEGSLPEKVDFLCVVPRDLGTGLGLSKELEPLVPEVAKRAYEWLSDA